MRRRKMNFKSILVGVILCLMANIASAVPVFYFNDPVTDRVTFQTAALEPLVFESFEDTFPTQPTVSFPVGGPQAFTVSINIGNLRQNSFARLVSDGNFALSFEEFPSSTVTFIFDNPINSFGINVNDMNFGTMSYLDDLGNSISNVLVGDNGDSRGGPGYENIQFFGVTNNVAFSSIQLSFINGSGLTGTLALDTLEYSIPEPGTICLLGLGGLLLRRRKSA